MAFSNYQRMRRGIPARTRKMLRKPAGNKRRLKRKSSFRGKSGKGGKSFTKRVKSTIHSMCESKFIGIHLETKLGTVPVNIKVNDLQFLSVDPLVSLTAAYNLLERRALLVSSEASKPMALIGC